MRRRRWLSVILAAGILMAPASVGRADLPDWVQDGWDFAMWQLGHCLFYPLDCFNPRGYEEMVERNAPVPYDAGGYWVIGGKGHGEKTHYVKNWSPYDPRQNPPGAIYGPRSRTRAAGPTAASRSASALRGARSSSPTEPARSPPIPRTSRRATSHPRPVRPTQPATALAG